MYEGNVKISAGHWLAEGPGQPRLRGIP